MHDGVIKWNHLLRHWPFVWGIHRSPMNSPHKGRWCGALMFSLICAWINGSVNNREAGDLRRHHAHYIWCHFNEIIFECIWKYIPKVHILKKISPEGKNLLATPSVHLPDIKDRAVHVRHPVLKTPALSVCAHVAPLYGGPSEAGAITRLPKWRRRKIRLQGRALLTLLWGVDCCHFWHASRYGT